MSNPLYSNSDCLMDCLPHHCDPCMRQQRWPRWMPTTIDPPHARDETVHRALGDCTEYTVYTSDDTVQLSTVHSVHWSRWMVEENCIASRRCVYWKPRKYLPVSTHRMLTSSCAFLRTVYIESLELERKQVRSAWLRRNTRCTTTRSKSMCPATGTHVSRCETIVLVLFLQLSYLKWSHAHREWMVLRLCYEHGLSDAISASVDFTRRAGL